MKIIIFSLLLVLSSAVTWAKPGETYILTGKEKSVFAIFQEDMRAHPELYKDADVNACYQEFKRLNDLDSGRKLKIGEELKVPHTEISRKLMREEKKRLERERAAAEVAEAKKNAAKQAENDVPAEEDLSDLFGSDAPGHQSAEEKRMVARGKAVLRFEQKHVPSWMYAHWSTVAESGKAKELIRIAHSRVDMDYADAMKLHAYPEKKIYVVEFEEPKTAGGLLFFALKQEPNGRVSFYSLAKEISFFGAGSSATLWEWKSGWNKSELGGREYADLSGFVAELETGPSSR